MAWSPSITGSTRGPWPAAPCSCATASRPDRPAPTLEVLATMAVAEQGGLVLTPEAEAHAADLHARSLVIDGSSVVNPEPGHIERFRAGGVNVTNHTVTH